MVLIVACGAVFAQARHASDKSAAERFLIDPTKPYVYLTVDHVGPRAPIREGEPKTGIWLRLHNNCIVPITVLTFGAGNDEEIGVFDHVIGDPSAGGLFPRMPMGTKAESFYDAPGYPTASELAGQLWGKGNHKAKPQAPVASAAKPSEWKGSKMPAGYWFDVAGVTTINPGRSIYFSIPRNQVSARWHVEIDFEFDLHVRSEIPSAQNYVSLYEDQVEYAIRGEKLK
jgi:hypothetical protein